MTDIPDDGMVLAAFEEFIEERAGNGVLFAKAVTSIVFDGTTVMAFFDPSVAGAEESTFLAVNPFDTLAEFVGVPIAFSNEQGRRLRTRVASVTVALADGRSLGTITTGDMYRKGTGQEWRPGL